MTIELKHQDVVRLAAWVGSTATVGTLNGYCSPERAEVCRQRGEPEVWVNYGGVVISSAAWSHKERIEKYARAIVLAEHDTVVVEGKQYRVHVVKGNADVPRNADPLHFIPLATEEAVS